MWLTCWAIQTKRNGEWCFFRDLGAGPAAGFPGFVKWVHGLADYPEKHKAIEELKRLRSYQMQRRFGPAEFRLVKVRRMIEITEEDDAPTRSVNLSEQMKAYSQMLSRSAFVEKQTKTF